MNRIPGRLAAAGLLVFAACGGETEGRTPGEMAAEGTGGRAVTLVGAGATFPFPLYSRWFNAYEQRYGVRVNYQSLGSGAGIRQFIEGTVDFGATDAPMSDEEIARAAGGALNLPTVVGAVVLTYNVPALDAALHLDGAAIAGIFLGEIKRWNDPRLVELNPGAPLPDRPILPVHRSDGSGTTFVFTDYLSAVSSEWQQRVGRGTAVRWPTGLGGKGNEGVTGQVRQTEGAIGYVEQVFARQNNLPMADVRNRAGEFIEPSPAASTAAAARLDEKVQEQGDFRVSIVDPAGAEAYPIASLTYLLIRPHMDDCAKARGLVRVVEWALVEGDSHAEALHYSPLPEPVKEGVLAQLQTVTCGSDRQPAGEAR